MAKVKLNFEVKTEIVVNQLADPDLSIVSDSDGESLRGIDWGCASCGASSHDVLDCNYRGGSNYKYVQFENVRAKFARDVGFNYKSKQSEYGNRDSRHSSSRHESRQSSDHKRDFKQSRSREKQEKLNVKTERFDRSRDLENHRKVTVVTVSDDEEMFRTFAKKAAKDLIA